MFRKSYPLIYPQGVSSKIFTPMNINFYLKNYINKEGKSPIYMYITSGGKRERIPMDIFIKPADWDNSKRRAKPKSENSETINLLLDQAYTKVSDIRVHYRLSKMHLSIDKLIDEFKNLTPNHDFISFMKHHTENLILRPSSYKKHLS